MTAKHTPGPWVAKTTGMDAAVVCPDGRFFDCGDIVYHPENIANARLIAAAPDLLSQLADLVSRCEMVHEEADGRDERMWLCGIDRDYLNECSALIKQARGL